MRGLLSLSQMDFDDCYTITAQGNHMVWIPRLTIKMTVKIKNRTDCEITLSILKGVGMSFLNIKMFQSVL